MKFSRFFLILSKKYRHFYRSVDLVVDLESRSAQGVWDTPFLHLLT